MKAARSEKWAQSAGGRGARGIGERMSPPDFDVSAAQVLDLARAADQTVWALGLIAMALIGVGLALSRRARRETVQTALLQRLLRLEAALAALDRGVALCVEIEDRYSHPNLRGETEQGVLLSLRRELAVAVGEARSAIEAFGELRDPRAAVEAFAIAERPVFVNELSDEDLDRSLKELRRACVRMRLDQVEVVEDLRSRLDRRAWRPALRRDR